MHPYTAKVAVGAVVINRVQDSRFPKSINDVIYQKMAVIISSHLF